MFKNRIVSELISAARGNRSNESPEGREEGSDLQERLRGALSQTEQIISKYPLAVLGTALCAGVLLGYWIKRR